MEKLLITNSEAEKKEGSHASPETHVLTDLSADVLENVKARPLKSGFQGRFGSISGERFY